MINVNVGGTLKALTAVSTQPIAGTIKRFDTVYANAGGALKKLFPDEKPNYMFQISHTGGGGTAGQVTQTTTKSDWQTAEIGYSYQYSTTVSVPGAEPPAISFVSESAEFYPKENCRLKINTLTNATISINGIKMNEGTYSVSTTDKISFNFSISVSSKGLTEGNSQFGAINFELIS